MSPARCMSERQAIESAEGRGEVSSPDEVSVQKFAKLLIMGASPNVRFMFFHCSADAAPAFGYNRRQCICALDMAFMNRELSHTTHSTKLNSVIFVTALTVRELPHPPLQPQAVPWQADAPRQRAGRPMVVRWCPRRGMERPSLRMRAIRHNRDR